MQAKLYQITPYNIIDNNFYNFQLQTKFNKFLDQIEKPIQKEVSVVRLENYNKIMYKLQFNNAKEEKTFCGFKYMIVDDKYWFITNFEVKKNNNIGFITYYAQLDHWATQWLNVKNHLHNNLNEKSLYVERMHQNRWYLKDNSLYVNFDEHSPFHNEEKINVNNYIPNKSFELFTVDENKNKFPKKNELNKCYYFLRLQLNKPVIESDSNGYTDFCRNFVFIPLNENNMARYLGNFNPVYMKVFSVLDKKIFKYEQNTSWWRKYTDKPDFEIRENEYLVSDINFYKQMSLNISTLYDEINIEKIPYNFVSQNYTYYKNLKNELVLLTYPYTKYIFTKGNNFKEYKIDELLYNDTKIRMNYFSFISYNIYNLWIFPTRGIFNQKDYRSNLHHALSIQNNLEIPTTSNSYTTYAQSNLNSLQTNINQAEQTRKIANQESSTGLIVGIVTTALGVALAPFSFGSSLGLTAVGAAYTGLQTNKWINNQIKNNFEVDSLSAKISDMKNTPNTISASNNDYYWLTYFNNGGYFNYENKKVDETSISRFYVSSINDFDKKILFDWYYYNGYLFNRYTNNLHFDEFRNRYILNFYKIKDLKTILSTCPEICNEDIEWWNNTFKQGIVVWETEDPLKLYEEQIHIGNNKYENWETELLKEDYVLNQIKNSKKINIVQQIIELATKKKRLTFFEEKELVILLLKTDLSDQVFAKQLITGGIIPEEKIKTYVRLNLLIERIKNNLTRHLKNEKEPDMKRKAEILRDLKIVEFKEKLKKILPNDRIFESKSSEAYVYEGLSLKVFYILWRNDIKDKWRLIQYENKVVIEDTKIDEYKNNSLYLSEGNQGTSSLIIKNSNNKIVRNFYNETTDEYFKVYMYEGANKLAPKLDINTNGNLTMYDVEITF